ncbi:hypothetical protein GOBAR_DD23805 [Gossypium barbadense]|nr:hypothetical protein GOBAR_DD23805 [Gossypium barbadense]
MSSTEERGGPVGAPGGAVSTDQTITTDTNPLETIIPITDTDFTVSNGELENLRSLGKDGDQVDLRAKPLIQRVPPSLGHHEDFRKYFKPKVISIGPLHHADPTLHKSEKLKLELAALFFKKIGIDKHTLYNNMKTEIDGLKKCYDPKALEKCSYDNAKLAWMFFVDGCANLQAVYMLYGPDYCRTPNEFLIKNELLTFVYSDLFLLENQLPFHVLELLTSSGDGKKFMDSIIRFINGTVKNPQSHSRTDFGLVNGGRSKESEFTYCIYYDDHTRTKPHHSHPFRNVNGLKNAGIWLEASETSCLADISFNRYFFVGKLRLPPITIDDSTMNLIAYEMCPDFYNNNFAVTSYMGFLDSLIDEAEDVKELRDSGILYNRLGSDKEVAKLIKKMNMDLVPSLMIYRHVKLQIHDHHNNMWIRYPAQVYRTFFRTRWTFFAFVGAIGALFIGVLQAYYTIHQPK